MKDRLVLGGSTGGGMSRSQWLWALNFVITGDSRVRASKYRSEEDLCKLIAQVNSGPSKMYMQIKDWHRYFDAAEYYTKAKPSFSLKPQELLEPIIIYSFTFPSPKHS